MASMLAVGPAAAGFEEGATAYRAGDPATAFREWQPLAEAGDDRAQYNLGVLYRRGEGVAQDSAAALGWFRRSAQQGNALAMVNLGLIYGSGEGVQTDLPTARMWMVLAERNATDEELRQDASRLGTMMAAQLGAEADAAAIARADAWQPRSEVDRAEAPSRMAESTETGDRPSAPAPSQAVPAEQPAGVDGAPEPAVADTRAPVPASPLSAPPPPTRPPEAPPRGAADRQMAQAGAQGVRSVPLVREPALTERRGEPAVQLRPAAVGPAAATVEPPLTQSRGEGRLAESRGEPPVDVRQRQEAERLTPLSTVPRSPEPSVASTPAAPSAPTLPTGPAEPVSAAPSAADAGAPPTISPDGGFGVQIASLTSEEDATRQWQRLRATHADLLGDYEPRTTTAEVGGVTRFRVRIGPFDWEAADSLCGRLQARGADCYAVEF